ncbi:hypothetical protein EC844_1391 [Acinetobacter calcoaceticus]|uniref:Uncharacterized protein n=1 Tax=Acinetobacter calcoaceticus TaxID=471 RepID=A0A4V2QZ83_ACICA|nr:hypothetical protein EC844_1391 [Acinetobacter calcoaceticus]
MFSLRMELIELIKAISTKESDTLRNGSVSDLLKLYEQQEYAVLFKQNHPGQSYLFDEWVADEEYQQVMQDTISLYRSGNYKNLEVKISKPQANFLSKYGEVCVINKTMTDEYLNTPLKTESLDIYVRHLANNQWRVLSYQGTELPENFKEFFPDFPKNIKLKSAKINGLDPAESSYVMSVDYLKNAKIEITDEIQQSLDQAKKDTKARLKLNGF